jgi:hypothetical protein
LQKIDILKCTCNSTYTLEEKLLNTGISVYEFLLLKKNIAKYASAYIYNVERERERERERFKFLGDREVGGGGSQGLVFWNVEIKKI